MKGIANILSTTVALTATSAFAASLTPRQNAATTSITVKGNAFFQGDTRFYVRGVDYQPGGSSKLVDPLADSTTCTRDIAKFKDLGLNTVRVYSVDNSANHDTCMKALSDAGIYLVLDVNTPQYSLNRNDPHTSYNDVYLQNVFATIDAFAKYNNTLAFFSGNEVVNDQTNSTACAPYIKAVTRDMRSYISSRKLRQIPVGYSAADVDTVRLELAQYMNCGSNDERSDFFAFNDYSWCDPSSSYTISKWDQKVKNFTNYGLPLFLSEFGCIKGTRDFMELASLYGTDMTPVYSGGLVYEYSEEGSGYGLVTINGDSVTEGKDYSALKSSLSANKMPTGDGGYNKTGGASTCPAQSVNWPIGNDTLPAIPQPAEKYMTQGAGKGLGFGTVSSQTAGTPSSGDAKSGSGTGSAATPSGTAGKKSSAVALRAPEFGFSPLVCGVVAVVSTFLGAALL
ncbi:MAG: beta-glucanosyltransferase [Candelaria pacifica]|nr:MAG: beta-glucanosyltransferase [Candelaria pacifica]